MRKTTPYRVSILVKKAYNYTFKKQIVDIIVWKHTNQQFIRIIYAFEILREIDTPQNELNSYSYYNVFKTLQNKWAVPLVSKKYNKYSGARRAIYPYKALGIRVRKKQNNIYFNERLRYYRLLEKDVKCCQYFMKIKALEIRE